MNIHDGKVAEGLTYYAIRDYCKRRNYKCKGCMYRIDKVLKEHSKYQTCIFGNCPSSWEEQE